MTAVSVVELRDVWKTQASSIQEEMHALVLPCLNTEM
jgi:hypothetical protein